MAVGGQDEPALAAEQTPEDPQAWMDAAAQRKGTWWDDYVAWLGERSGAEKPARKRLGGKGYKPLDPAPGLYVLD